MATKNLKLFYSPAYNATSVAFDTTRKADAIADSLVSRPIEGIEILEPSLIYLDLVTKVHDPDYIDAVKTGTPGDLASSNGIGWSEDLFAAVLASTSGVCSAAEAALSGHRSGSLSSGLHHARYGSGIGYCTINGLAVAAVHARDIGAARVLIVDFDAHCGGGTASLIAHHQGIEQIDVSVSTFDGYAERANARLWMASGSNYITTISEALESVVHPESVDLVLYNAGMDPHELAGGAHGIDKDILRRREELVYDWISTHALSCAFVLAGGYKSENFGMDKVVELHRLTISTATTR